MTAVAGSGIKIMSDSLMPFQPAIDEPSNILPSLKKPSSTKRVGTVTCCSLPIVSVKRRSANVASFSLINSKTSTGVMCVLAGGSYMIRLGGRARSTGTELSSSCISELVHALHGNTGLTVCEGVDARIRVDRPHEGSFIGFVVAGLHAQFETLHRGVTKRH